MCHFITLFVSLFKYGVAPIRLCQTAKPEAIEVVHSYHSLYGNLVDANRTRFYNLRHQYYVRARNILLYHVSE